MIAYEIRYAGNVQRVFFRATAKEFAESHGAAGYVRNLPDGSVELFVQGSEAVVTSFLADVAERYRENIVDESRKSVPSDPALDAFEIRR